MRIFTTVFLGIDLGSKHWGWELIKLRRYDYYYNNYNNYNNDYDYYNNDYDYNCCNYYSNSNYYSSNYIFRGRTIFHARTVDIYATNLILGNYAG